jgi:hypothetical protein
MRNGMRWLEVASRPGLEARRRSYEAHNFPLQRLGPHAAHPGR